MLTRRWPSNTTRPVIAAVASCGPRIADQAQGGQILVSSLLKELTESAGDISFGKAREVELKGLAGLNRIYPVLWDEF